MTTSQLPYSAAVSTFAFSATVSPEPDDKSANRTDSDKGDNFSTKVQRGRTFVQTSEGDKGDEHLYKLPKLEHEIGRAHA